MAYEYIDLRDAIEADNGSRPPFWVIAVALMAALFLGWVIARADGGGGTMKVQSENLDVPAFPFTGTGGHELLESSIVDSQPFYCQATGEDEPGTHYRLNVREFKDDASHWTIAVMPVTGRFYAVVYPKAEDGHWRGAYFYEGTIKDGFTVERSGHFTPLDACPSLTKGYTPAGPTPGVEKI
jgi:hypothetical protein